MAFADTMLSETDATLVIVDGHDRPGGHWNDAYSFVRLHQPSATYGVNSRPLGSGRIDTHKLNEGMYELATGAEIVGYFDRLMQDRFLPSGRVRYLPMSHYANGEIKSSVSGQSTPLVARRLVDGTLNHTSVPSRHRPGYAVAPNMICIPPNDLPGMVRPGAQYVIIGAGKTGMDTACWLLDHGLDPDAIRWIMPRVAWVLDRSHFQPGRQFLEAFTRSGADQVEAVSKATSITDLFARLEACGEIRRIDQTVTPTAYHCATLSDGELCQLRRIRGVVRMGRLTAIEPDRIRLESGSIPTSPDVVHIDCSAQGIPKLPELPVFDGDRINLLWVRQCQPVFSAAMIAFVEAHFTDAAEKNRLCAPIPAPQVPLDWLRMLALDLVNSKHWAGDPQLSKWLANIRLNVFAALLRELGPDDAAEATHQQRYQDHLAMAEARAFELLAGTHAPAQPVT